MKRIETWQCYLEHLAQKYSDPPPLDSSNYAELITKHQHFQPIYQFCIPMTFVSDLCKGTFLKMSDGCTAVLGYPVDEVVRSGMKFLANKMHPDDFSIYNEQVFPDRIQFLKTVPAATHQQYVFTCHVRIKNQWGEYVTLVNRTTFIQSDNDNQPLKSLDVLTLASLSTPLLHLIQVIEKMDPSKHHAPVEISKHHYFHQGKDSFFSRREKEILQYSIEGLTHKEIASKLFIADGTVLQHRKAMLHKTKTKNIAELVAFAIRNDHF